MAYELPPLPYDYAALEPHIDTQTMQIHHDRHHATYVTNLNNALKDSANLGNQPVEQLIQHLDQVPEGARTAVRNNGGGHANHSLFWQVMGPNQGGQPSGELADAINRTFGGFDQFKQQFTQAATTRFGSGWAWLVTDSSGNLSIISTPNQDNPLMQEYGGKTPLLGLDVWEHAYYLKYQNKRPDYIGAWWNTVNWNAVSQRYQQAHSH